MHELAYLLERHHTERFTGLLDQHLPQWRTLREELNGSVLTEF
ncbi:YgjP-like metallopeptidase domain-containing protein [Aquipseudomonas alcaligenes]